MRINCRIALEAHAFPAFELPPKTRRHTYVAWIHRVIDGDTLPGEDDPNAVRDQGIYLNRQLLNEHLAVRYLE